VDPLGLSRFKDSSRRPDRGVGPIKINQVKGQVNDRIWHH
jgi:hypothetical protein